MPSYRLAYRIFNLAALLFALLSIQPILLTYAQPEIIPSTSLITALTPSTPAGNRPRPQIPAPEPPSSFLSPSGLPLKQALGDIAETDGSGSTAMGLEPVISPAFLEGKSLFHSDSLPVRPDLLNQLTRSVAITGTISISITDGSLTPSILTTTVNAPIIWLNTSNRPQRLRGGTPVFEFYLPLILKNGSDNQGSMSPSDPLPDDLSPEAWSDTILPGQTFSRVFTQTGKYLYHLADSPAITGVIVVQPSPTFLISFSPSTQTVTQGQVITYSYVFIGAHGLTEPVTLTLGSTLEGVNGLFDPNPVASMASGVLTVTTTLSTPIGTHPLTTTAESDVISQTAQVSLTVTPVSVDKITVSPEAGGVLISSDNRLRLEIPAGAVSSTTTISYWPVPDPNLPGYQSTGLFFELTAQDENGNPVTQFNRNLDFTVTYEDAPGVDEVNLALYYTQDELYWWPLSSTVDVDANQIFAKSNHFTNFSALACVPPSPSPASPYEVGIDANGKPAGYTDAFRMAYCRNGGKNKIGLPFGPVHDWAGALIQDFDWASIIYNPNKGTAYYLQGEYISKYVDNGGPSSYLGLPVSDRYDPPADALLLDKHTNFMKHPIQQFEGGFIGNDTNGSNGSGYMIHPYYPILSGASVKVEHYDPDPDDNTVETKARVLVDAYDIYPKPTYKELGSTGSAHVWVDIESDQFGGDWIPNEGQGVKIWDNLEPEGEFSFRLQGWVDDAAGYVECDSYQREDAKEDYLIGPIPLDINNYFLERFYYCSGLGGGGGWGSYRDTTPPVIHEPPDIWQNGMGWAVVTVRVTDNVAVDWVKVILDGQEHLMTLIDGNAQDGTYSVAVQLKRGKNTFVIKAADTAGNKVTSSEYEIWSTMDGLFGNRPYMGYSDDPVNTYLGNFIYNYVDVEIPVLGPDVTIDRWYNHQSRYDGPFGIGWTFIYDMRLEVVNNLLLTGAQVRYGDGHTVNFESDGAGKFTSTELPYDVLTQEGSDYVLTSHDNIAYRFNADGRLASISDEDGNSITLTYSGDELSSLVDASGRTLSFTYTGGRITSIDIPDYGTLEYTYTGDRLASATDTEGNTSEYTYDDTGCMLSITSPDGNPYLAEQRCNEEGQVVFQRGGTTYVNEFTYVDTTTTTILDPYGNPAIHVYDENFNLIENQDALGHSVTTTYRDDHLPLTQTDKNGQTTTYTYDDRGNPLTITDAQGNVTSYTYDNQNNVLSRTDALGNTFTYEYDSEGHLVKATDPLGGVVEHSYNSAGLLVRTVDELGHVTSKSYNAQGLVETITDALGNVSTMVYDDAGHLLSQTDASGNRATYRYNSRGLVESVTDPEGYTTTYNYDADRHLISETNQDGYTKRYTYDQNGRLIAETDWAGNITTYEYDDLGRKVAETDPLGYTTTFEYDAVGNLVAKTDKRGATTTYSYDPNGNRLTETDALGNITRYIYDELNQQVEVHYPCDCASRVEYTEYDALGQITKRTDALGNVTRFEYDALGRETKRFDALGYETTKVYDLAGNLIAEVDALGQSTTYEYDALNQLIRTTNRLGDSASKVYDESGRMIGSADERGNTTHYRYDGNNRLIEKIDALGHSVTYTYDGRGNPLTMSDALGRVTISTYDANSNLITQTNPRGFTTTYEYDALNRRVKMIDALGGVTTYTYDAAGAQLTETDALGFVRQTSYDILGRTLTETDRNGNITTNAYDAAGNLKQVTDALGGVTRYTYDANNNRLSETNALGFTTTYEYDALNRQIKVIDALNGISTRAYDALGRLVETVDANGHATTHEYDAEGRQIATTDALGHTGTVEYDPTGNAVKETDRNGNVTTYIYDALNRQVSTTNALGHTAGTEYDAVGNTIEQTNFRGYTTRFEYDENNNRIRTIDALGGVTLETYDALDRRVSVTDANGHTTTYAYDAVGNLITVTLPEGQLSTYTYDGERNRISFTNGRGFTTTYQYDALNRQVKEIDPLGHTTTTIYDAIGQTVGDVDANGNGNTYRYDALGRLVTVTDALGHNTTYTYDAVGNRLSKTDANGHTSAFSYDEVNRLVQETDAEGNTWRYTYDPEGNLIERLDANGQITRYEFDAVHQLIALRYTDASQNVTYGYDENGNLVRINDPVGVTEFVYDALDRQVSQNDLYGRTILKTYDAVGNQIGMTYPDGNRVGYSYNGNDWLVAMTDGRNGQTRYTYLDDGQVNRMEMPNGTWRSHTYDDAGRLIGLFNGTSYHAGVITSYDYTLDAVGNRLRVVEEYTQGQVRTNLKTYRYNDRYEVVEAVEEYEGPPAYTVTTSYTYDPAGNRLSMTTNRDLGPGPQPAPETTLYVYDKANRLLSAGAVTYTYDRNGNRLTKLTPARPPAQSRLETYTYDVENRLVEYNRERTQNGHIEQQVFNVYDGLGRRVNKGLQNSSGAIKWTEYALDGLSYDQLAEFPQTGSPRVTELYRGLDNELLSMDEIQGGGVGSQYWFAADGLNSVAATTKQNGQSSHEFFYDPYGQLIDENGHWEDSSSWTNPHNHYLLTGKEWDEESRLYYFGARFYDAEAGVWLTPDPYRGEARLSQTLHPYLNLGRNAPPVADNANSPMSTHRYLYAQNNPLNRVDPLGFFDWINGWVERGDTLWQIAQDAQVTMAQIRQWNPQIEYPDHIVVGDYIWLPKTATNAGIQADAIRTGNNGEKVWGKYNPKKEDELTFDHPVLDYIVREINTNSSSNTVKEIKKLNESCMHCMYDEMDNWQRALIPRSGGGEIDPYASALIADSSSRMVALAKWGAKVCPSNWSKYHGLDCSWDHKPIILSRWGEYQKIYYGLINLKGSTAFYFDIWSNIHYGYVGKAAGFSNSQLLNGAALAQALSNVYDCKCTGAFTFADNPNDANAIQIGMKLYNKQPSNLTKAQLIKALHENKNELSHKDTGT